MCSGGDGHYHYGNSLEEQPARNMRMRIQPRRSIQLFVLGVVIAAIYWVLTLP